MNLIGTNSPITVECYLCNKLIPQNIALLKGTARLIRKKASEAPEEVKAIAPPYPIKEQEGGLLECLLALFPSSNDKILELNGCSHSQAYSIFRSWTDLDSHQLDLFARRLTTSISGIRYQMEILNSQVKSCAKHILMDRQKQLTEKKTEKSKEELTSQESIHALRQNARPVIMPYQSALPFLQMPNPLPFPVYYYYQNQ